MAERRERRQDGGGGGDMRMRRRAARPRKQQPHGLLPLLLPLLLLLALCGRGCAGEEERPAAADALTALIPALATPDGASYLSALPPATVASLAAGVEAMTPERKSSLASMSFDAVRRVFAAATAAAGGGGGGEEAAAKPAAAALSATTATPAKGRAAALAALAAKGLGNDDGLLDEPSLKTLRALSTLPEARLREFAALATDARAAALSFFADGVGACSAKVGGTPM